MKRRTRARRIAAVALAGGMAAAGPAALGGTAVKPYVVPVGTAYDVKALLSVADEVPVTGDPSRRYRMVGIPDGLGAYGAKDGTVVLYMNHELGQTVTSQPYVGGASNRGAFVSRFVLEPDGDVVSGSRAHDRVFVGDTLVGPAAEVGNATPGMARLCSGFLAGPAVGFDRPIYLAGEEVEGAASFDGKGGLLFAFFDGEAHALPDVGRYPKENAIVMPGTGDATVIVGLEDGPRTPDSQLYLYVGTKDHRPGATVLERNGLVGGKLYVFASTTPGKTSEANFDAGAISGGWVEIPGAAGLTDAQLEAASDAAGAFGFVRVEDGAFNIQHKHEFYFVTTGESTDPTINSLGRLYGLRLDGETPTGPAELKLVYDADAVVAAGGDIAVSPDNIDLSKGYLMINEDGHSRSRPVMAAKGRDGSIWRFELADGSWKTRVDVASAERVAELDPPGRDGIAVGAGVWETSGIVDTTGLFGSGESWLTDVQAHSPTTAPLSAAQAVEDGQLVLLTPHS